MPWRCTALEHLDDDHAIAAAWTSRLASALLSGTPCSVSNAFLIGAGTSPSGKMKLLPGSKATMALTLRFFIAASQPGPPLRTYKPV
jgi:hypothetical protein